MHLLQVWLEENLETLYNSPKLRAQFLLYEDIDQDNSGSISPISKEISPLTPNSPGTNALSPGVSDKLSSKSRQITSRDKKKIAMKKLKGDFKAKRELMQKILEHYEQILILKQQKKRINHVEKVKQQIKKAVDFRDKQGVVRKKIEKDIIYFIPNVNNGVV